MSEVEPRQGREARWQGNEKKSTQAGRHTNEWMYVMNSGKQRRGRS